MPVYRFCLKACSLFVLSLFCLTHAPAAEADATSLRVVVLDQNGAVVVAARVRVRTAEGREQTVNTDEQGAAVFSNLSPGKYRVSVEGQGFAARELDDVVVKRGSNKVEVNLEISGIDEDVVVRQDEREQRTDPRGDAFATILTEAQIANLPDDPQELEAALKRMAGPGTLIRVDGFGGGRLPPKSQIRQIRFRRDSYAAENHAAGFVGVDIITRPGVQNWHGSLSFGFRDEALNARNAFAPERSPEQFRRLEGTLDIPLWRNRTSLFLAADGNQSFDAQTIVAALPEGGVADIARRPSRDLYLSARVNHALSKTHTLSARYERNARQADNLGVGNFDLPERAFSSGQAENFLRVVESGTVAQKYFNELRLQVRWLDAEVRPASDATAVVVLDAFRRGGAQRRSADRSRNVEVGDNIDFAVGNHAMRAGLLLEAGTYRNDSSFNAGGTFTFASLDDFRAARPATFTQRIGHRPVEFSHYRFGAYWQDDYRLRPSLMLSFGMRFESQNHLRDKNNFAPRIGVAWSPFKDGKMTFRGGAGIFYDWLSAENIGAIKGFDGQQQRDVVILNPSFPDPFGESAQTTLAPGRFQFSQELANPSIRQASLSVENRLTRTLSLTTSYLYQRGTQQFRARDINAPLPGTGRPDPAYGNIVQVESTASSSAHVLDFTLNRVLSKRLYWLVNYTLSRATNETDSPFSLPADNSNLLAERGPAPEDVRHRLHATVGLQLFRGLRLASSFYANSATPYDVTTGRDDNGDTVFNDRPAGFTRNSMRGAPQWEANVRLSWLLAFGSSGDGGQRQGPRTIKINSADVGAAVSELAASDKRWRMNLYVQASNLFNHTNLTNYTGVETSPFFGQATAAQAGRRIETGVRWTF